MNNMTHSTLLWHINQQWLLLNGLFFFYKSDIDIMMIILRKITLILQTGLTDNLYRL